MNAGAADAPGRVLFWVQHLLGVGHLTRAGTIARAAAARGLDVTLVSGGPPAAVLDSTGFTLVQLPPVSAGDRRFKSLVDQDGREIDDAFRTARRDQLLALLEQTSPDILITELFPFGRRQLRWELLPLLDAAKASARPPTIVCSVRDILVDPPEPHRVDQLLGWCMDYYDVVMIHGDPEFIPFDRTFARTDEIRDRLHYTGYVVDAAAAPGVPAQDAEVIVSAGSSAVGGKLLHAAIDARARTSLADRCWRLLVGAALPDDAFRTLQEYAHTIDGRGIIVERARPDFAALLAGCALSISQGGYNTVMEVLATRTRGVIVPYAGGRETEQTLRAELMQRASSLKVLQDDDITSENLARAVEMALASPPPAAALIDAGGAARSADLLAELARARQDS